MAKVMITQESLYQRALTLEVLWLADGGSHDYTGEFMPKSAVQHQYEVTATRSDVV